jgi:hypothetical protein
LTSPIALWAATTPRKPAAAELDSVPVLMVYLPVFVKFRSKSDFI